MKKIENNQTTVDPKEKDLIKIDQDISKKENILISDENYINTESKFEKASNKVFFKRKNSSTKSTLSQYLAQQLKNMKSKKNDFRLFNNFKDYNEKFDIKEIFYSYFCCKDKKIRYKKKQQLREELINDYQNIFDLANFPKLIYEVELLKKILLSKEERNSLEILSIPVIAIDENYNVCFKKIPKREIDLDFDFIKYYEELNLKNEISITEKRLFRLMNKYIIQKGNDI